MDPSLISYAWGPEITPRKSCGGGRKGRNVDVPKIRSRAHTRARIVAAAMVAFAEVGFDGASVEDICDRAGFTRGAFYSNFTSKDELFIELAEVAMTARRRALREHLTSISESSPAQRVRLEVALEHMLREAVGDVNAVMLAHEVRMRALRDHEFGQDYLEMEESLAQDLCELISVLLIGTGRSTTIEVFDAALILVHMWDSVVVRAAVAAVSGEDLIPEARDELVAVIGLLLVSADPDRVAAADYAELSSNVR